MSIRKITAIAIAGLVTITAFAVSAQDSFVAPATAEEAVAMRKALMREDGGILRSAGGLSGAEAVAAMQTLQTNYSHIPDLFPEGSIVGDSRALPVIWENWDEFVAIVQTGEQAATEGLAAAESGDTVAYAAALETLGGTCGACHQQFRGPE